MDLEELSTFDFESKETWEQDWKTDDPEFHTNEVNAMLINHHHEFTDGRNNLRILVPLCGKSLDMIWLADQGHSVVGVELVRKGIELFFSDNKLTYSEKQVSVKGTLNSETQGTVFKAREKDISLYECSIFDFSAEVAGGKFDCIWDRGSMTAINMMNEERIKQYRDITLACLKPNGRYFLEFFAPESLEEMSTSFKFVSEKSLIDLFGERCAIRFLGKDQMPGDVTGSDEQTGEACNEYVQNLAMSMHYYFMDFK